MEKIVASDIGPEMFFSSDSFSIVPTAPPCPIDRPAPAACSAREDFQQLDPRVVTLWRSAELISTVVCLAILSMIGVGLGLFYSTLLPWLVPLLIALTAASVWLICLRPPRLYRSWGYRIDERVLETRSGLLIQTRRLLPLARLQHVDLRRGLLERAHGLATLVLHTAGTQEAKITIPGLDAEEAARLRDRLVEIGGNDAV